MRDLQERSKRTEPIYYHEQIRGDLLKKDLTGANPDNPFYDKKVVITGVFSIDRKELAAKLKSMGADIDGSVTKRTDFVIIGEDAGPKKLEKIESLNADGCSIKKVYEPELHQIFRHVIILHVIICQSLQRHVVALIQILISPVILTCQ